MDKIKLNRVWSMPNKWTFKIKPIKKLLSKYVGNGEGWVDPMCGFNSPAETKNDLNLETPTSNHLDALEFIKLIKSNSVNGVIFDPPYTYEKSIRLYKKKYLNTQNFYNYIKDCKYEICRIIKLKGKVILCGYNSTGLGKKNGFKLLEVLIVPHGWHCNDTIVTVEEKQEEIVKYPINKEKLTKFIEDKEVGLHKPLKVGSVCNYNGYCPRKSFDGKECLMPNKKCLKEK